jgi:hypothetical protein
MQLTEEVLRRGKRFIAIEQFNGTGFHQAVERVNGVMTLMRDFPLDGILTASNPAELSKGIAAAVTHYKVWRAHRGVAALSPTASRPGFPLCCLEQSYLPRLKLNQDQMLRGMLLLEAIGVEVVALVTKFLNPRGLLFMPSAQFNTVRVNPFCEWGIVWRSARVLVLGQVTKDCHALMRRWVNDLGLLCYDSSDAARSRSALSSDSSAIARPTKLSCACGCGCRCGSRCV